MQHQTVVRVSDVSQVGEARRAASRLAEEAGLDETERGKVAIIATELGNNLLKHAGGGELLLQKVAGADAVELLSIDAGAGMADVDRCMRDGFSTAGTAGNGLGAVRRLSSEFDLFSAPSAGTVVLSRVARGLADAIPRREPFQWGGVCVPAPGESACGDGWGVAVVPEMMAVVVADGLGHGPLAAEASREALRVFFDAPFSAPKTLLESAHRAMGKTRGAAVAVARLEPPASTLRYCGVGNISGTLLSGDASRGLFTHNGTVGLQVRKVQEFDYPWGEAGLLIMHSDGLQTRWTLDRYPGLRSRHPAVVAGVLHRDFRRGRDDSTVVVLRYIRQGVRP